MDQPVRILAIESSCDETAAALVENGRTVLSDAVASQIDTHYAFGGVVPEIASRKHIEVIAVLTEQVLKAADVRYQDIDAVAVTNTPGLIGALLVGLSYAKAFAYGIGRPLITVNHLHAHIYANFVRETPVFPAVCLVVSGGHTSLLYMRDPRSFEVLGETRDDAAGEAFDKVARFLGLGYPGGPVIQQAAERGTPGVVKLPRVYLDRNDFEFSFSGLKTAAINLYNKLAASGSEFKVEDIAAEFQESLVEVLTEKTIMAAERYRAGSILLAGGVAANSRLREALTARAASIGCRFYAPPVALCTDNAVMVGCAAYYKYLEKEFAQLDANAYPNFDFLVKNACG
ncbi:MAG: tRNA (adenosine(37)-N6)-threonylcarbamoyltransferase complex transferase subunit TsaD [Solirubrobacterales bacterium]